MQSGFEPMEKSTHARSLKPCRARQRAGYVFGLRSESLLGSAAPTGSRFPDVCMRRCKPEVGHSGDGGVAKNDAMMSASNRVMRPDARLSSIWRLVSPSLLEFRSII